MVSSQAPEVSSQTSEDNSQTSEASSQTSEDSGQTSEDSGQTSEDNGQTSEDSRQTSVTNHYSLLWLVLSHDREPRILQRDSRPPRPMELWKDIYHPIDSHHKRTRL